MSVQVSYKKQTVIFIVLIFMTLLITEGVVRATNIVPTTCHFNDNELFDRYNQFEKNQICYEYTTIKADYTSPIRLQVPEQTGKYLNINSDGFRGSEFEFEPDDYKIFVLGGSTTFGFITSNDEYTIPALLEKKLNESDLDVHVVNAGIPGAYSRSELYLLENYILKFSPNMVIMYDGANEGNQPKQNFTYKEFNENSYFVNQGLESAANQHVGKTGLLTFFAQINYQTGIGLTQFIKSALFPTETDSSVKIGNELKQSDIFALRTDRFENNWSKICSVGNDNNFKTINIIQPVIGTSDRIFSESEKLLILEDLTPFLQSLNLNKTKLSHCNEIWDFRNAFEGIDEKSIFFDSVHMTDFGNEIIAEKIYQKILPIITEDVKKLS
jgi:lysophospholipase L1-like esterase